MHLITVPSAKYERVLLLFLEESCGYQSTKRVVIWQKYIISRADFEGGLIQVCWRGREKERFVVSPPAFVVYQRYFLFFYMLKDESV